MQNAKQNKISDYRIELIFKNTNRINKPYFLYLPSSFQAPWLLSPRFCQITIYVDKTTVGPVFSPKPPFRLQCNLVNSFLLRYSLRKGFEQLSNCQFPGPNPGFIGLQCNLVYSFFLLGPRPLTDFEKLIWIRRPDTQNTFLIEFFSSLSKTT